MRPPSAPGLARAERPVGLTRPRVCCCPPSKDKCEIVSPSANKALSKPSVPSECLSDPDSCTTGAKQGLFWSQASGNNLPAGLTAPPLYNAMYGFANGAQNDIFSEEAGIGEESDPVEDSAGARSVRGGSSVLAVGAASALLVVLLASA